MPRSPRSKLKRSRQRTRTMKALTSWLSGKKPPVIGTDSPRRPPARPHSASATVAVATRPSQLCNITAADLLRYRFTINRGVRVDEGMREATIAVLRERGWDGLTLERVAEVAGRARSTLWRQQITRESLIVGLLSDLAEEYRKAMYPVLTAPGSGRDRLGLAMEALCD